MRKKYLSALLFGALLFASAGTFTSCKDYDDDIDNLQGQITDVKNAVTELQKKIADQKYVSNVASEGNGLKITWNDGSTTSIGNVINEAMPEIPSPGDVITFDAETGEILVNGKASGYYTLTADEIWEEEEFKVPYVNEDGYLVLIDKDGNELVTNITVAPVSAIKNADGSYTITILSNGEKQEVVVPSAASAIKSVELYGKKEATGEYKIETKSYVFKLADDSGLRKIWNGCKTLPVNDAHIVRATTLPAGFGMRINPVDVDASEIALKLTNSANKDLSDLTLKATANDGVQIGTPRAAAKGGVYDLTVNDIILGKKASDLTDWTDQLKKGIQNINFAVNTGAVRSNYAVQVTSTEEPTNSNLQLAVEVKDVRNSNNNGFLYDQTAENITPVTFDKGKEYTIQATDKKNLYDLMITADAEAIANYGLEIDQEKHTIKVGKDIDVSTSGEFQFTVYGVTVQGKACTFIYKVKVSDKIVTTGEYTEISHAINAADNFFGIDLSIMKNAMSAEELNTWKTRVDLSKTEYEIFAKYENGTLSDKQTDKFDTTGKLFKPTISETNVKNPTAVTEKSKANYVVLNVDNAQASGMKLFTTYYIQVTFKNANDKELNHIIVPVKFTAPTVAEQFEVKSGLEKDGVVYGFFTKADANGLAYYEIPTAFSKTAESVAYSVTGDVVEGTDKKSSDHFRMATTLENVVLYKNEIPDGANKAQDMYGKAFTMMAKAETYKNWKYAEDAQKQYKFKMVLLSPIYSGSFAANGTIKVKGGEAFEITNAQLSVKDYNGTAVNILQDVVKANTPGVTPPYVGAFSDVRIVATTATGVTGQITSAIVEKAVVGTDNKLEKAGVIAGRAASVATDAESKITITVKDAFGYTKSFELPVTVTAQ